MHNKGFETLGVNSVYTAFEVSDVGKSVEGIRALGIKGASVTIPHKIAVMEYLDEIEDIAAMIGSVNTIQNREGILIGTNTDVYGFYRALSEKTEIANKKIALIGSGGAARAIGFGLFYFSRPAKLVIAVRHDDLDAANELRASLVVHLGIERGDVEVILLTDWEKSGGDIDIIINSTPLGMNPNTNISPLRKNQIPEGITVMDIVYHPNETLLIKYAIEKGCRIVYGIDMLFYQGVKQFELWTGLKAPEAEMRSVLTEHLAKNQ